MPEERQAVDKWLPWALLTRRQIEESPSFRAGMTFKTEKKLRDVACRIIGDAGETLEQGIMTIATAQAYLNRFYAVKPYQKNDSFIVAVAALFVASKTENKPRALVDIAHACWRHWIDAWVREQKRRRKDVAPSVWDQKGALEKQQFRDPDFLRRLAEAAATAERVLLYTTGFQFNILTAFNALMGCKGCLIVHPDPVVAVFFGETINLQVVWNFVIEAYKRTRLCLEYDPRTIGIACYDMTAKQLNKEIPLVDGDLWWKYIAKQEGWDLALGSPVLLAAISEEIDKYFTPAKQEQSIGPAAANGFHDAAEAQAQPALAQPRSLPESLSAVPTPAGSPSDGPPQQPQVLSRAGQPAAPAAADGGMPSSQASLPGNAAEGPLSEAVPAEASPGLPLAAAQESTAQAQVKQKHSIAAAGDSVRFSPSDEFGASPRTADESAQTSAPSLLGPDGGDGGADPGPAPARGSPNADDEKRRSRLARLRAMMAGKRARPDAEAAPAGPGPKRAKSPPQLAGLEP